MVSITDGQSGKPTKNNNYAQQSINSGEAGVVGGVQVTAGQNL